MKKNSRTKGIFKLLTRNSLRILKSSKILIFQLGILLLIGITTLATIFMSTFLLSKSKNTVLNEGNLANLTTTIPTSYLENSVISNPNSVSNIYSGQTPADLELQEYFASNNWNYVFSKNLSVSDMITGDSFLLSLANEKSSINPNIINSLVLHTGSNLPQSINNGLDEKLLESIKFFYLIRELHSVATGDIRKMIFNFYKYENYMSIQPWRLAKLLIESNWNLEYNTTNNIIKLLIPLTKTPIDENDYLNNYYPFTRTSTEDNFQFNTSSYFYKLAQDFSLNKIGYNGYGYSIIGLQTIPLIGISADIPFSIEYFDKSSYFTILSTNYMKSNENSKSVLHPRTIKDVMQLPYKTNVQTDISLNPSLGTKVYNQDTGESELQTDFLTWFNNLDSKYKISINSLDYLITGIGDQPNLLYPVQSSSQLLVDSKSSGVAYVNSQGFMRATESTTYSPIVYYSVRYPPSTDLFKQSKMFNDLVNYTTTTYGQNTAYKLSDSSQPNRLLYLWANSLNNIQYIVTTIGGVIGGIIIALALIFISLLIRSIIKINKITFGIGLANGVMKRKLAFSFFPFALVPSIIFGTGAFFLSYFLVQPTLDSIKDYWTLNINSPFLYWWIWLGIIAGAFLLLYGMIITIIYITLRSKTQDILNSSGTFRLNPLIIYTKKLTNKMSPLWSFRTTFMMSNVTRFIILLFSVIYIISLSSIIVGSRNLFQTALEANSTSKNYIASYDLYTPTINSGYYSDIEYDMLGTSQKGMFNAYDTTTNNYNSPAVAQSNFYSGETYSNALLYPYANNLWFTSLFMQNSDLANEINWNFKFMDNRLFSKLLLDVNINALGAILNPWDFAKKVIPESIQNLTEQNDQSLVQTNFDFYLWLQAQNNESILNNNTQGITYKTFLPNVNGQPFTLDNSDISSDYETATNKNQWIFIKKESVKTGQQVWALNEDLAVNGAPSYTLKPQTAQLFTQLLTNNNNPLFQHWYKNIYDKNPNKGKEDQTIPDYNYKLASSAVPIGSNEETYTYLTSNILALNDNNINELNVKIIGVKDHSESVVLFDKNNNNLLSKLRNYEVKPYEIIYDDVPYTLNVYPIVINNVVEKKYKFKLNDILLTSTSNTFDRFNKINIGENSNELSLFQIVGITETNYNEQYYTLQKYANNILGFEDFSNVDRTVWSDRLNPSKGYVPFNGVFSKDPELKFIKNYGGFYSPSGLSTILGDFGATGEDKGPIYQLFNHNASEMDNLMNSNLLVDRTNGNKITKISLTRSQTFTFIQTVPVNTLAVDTIIKRITDLFGSSSPLVVSLTNVDYGVATSQVAGTFDKLLNSIETIIMVVMLPTLLIIIGLLAVIIVFESKRLIALLKILGYSNIRNLFSFLFVYIAVLVLGTIIAIPVTIAINQLISTIVFTAFNIITSISIPYLVFIIGFFGIGFIFAMLFTFIYVKMKKINLNQEISGR